MKNEQIEQYEEERSLSGIIYEKFLDTVERSSYDKILDVSGRIAVGVTLSTAFVLGNELGAVLASNNFAIPKVAGCLLFGWYKRPIFGAILYVRSRFMETLDRENQKEIGAPELSDSPTLSIDGISVEKIAEYISASRSFKREGAEKIGVGRTQADKISKGLERIGALVRGDKNSRILAEGYDLESLVLVLSNYAESGTFTTTERPTIGGGFTISRLESGGDK